MRAIKNLQHRLAGVSRELDKRLWKSLWIAVTALVVGGSLRPSALGRNSNRATSAKHRIKAIDRLLVNPRLHAAIEPIYRAVASLLFGAVPTVVVTVDWTQVDAKHQALVAAVPIGGRALPVLCHVHRVKQPTRRMHRKFLAALADVLPATCVPILVTDAGFQNSWIADVQARGWFYVARLRHRTCVRAIGESRWIPNKDLHSKASKKARDVGTWDIGKDYPKQRIQSRLVLVHKSPKGRHRKGRKGARLRGGLTKKLTKRQSEPWLLMTNLDTAASDVVAAYATRMQIEETFRDLKSGWELDSLRSRDPNRLAVALLIAVLGIISVTLVGLAAEKRGAHRQLQANTSTTRVLSLYLVGILVLTTRTSYRPSAGDFRAALAALRKHLVR